MHDPDILNMLAKVVHIATDNPKLIASTNEDVAIAQRLMKQLKMRGYEITKRKA
jgi:hypothetical protein